MRKIPHPNGSARLPATTAHAGEGLWELPPGAILRKVTGGWKGEVSQRMLIGVAEHLYGVGTKDCRAVIRMLNRRTSGERIILDGFDGHRISWCFVEDGRVVARFN